MAAVRELAAACEAADGAAPYDEAALLWLATHGLPPGGVVDDAVGAWGQPGEAGSGGEPGAPVTLHLAVHPSRRGTQLGGAFADRLAHDVGGPAVAWSHGDHPAAAHLAMRLGFARARELWVMRRDTSALPTLPAPDGVRLSTLASADEAARVDEVWGEVLAVNAAAFRSHPEQGALDWAGVEQRVAEEWFDPAGLVLARGDAGELLGFHWTKTHATDDGLLGEVYVVGVAPAAQGRGLGPVLTLAGLHHLLDEPPSGRGVGGVLLYVEALNRPAITVYERLGFTHAAVDTHVQYARD